MPELPDIVTYINALTPRIVGQVLERVRLGSPFLLRSVEPPLEAVEGRIVRSIERLGKRIVIVMDGELFLVVHLMIAGRLRWREKGTALPRKGGLAAFDFATGTVIFTEAGSKRRASMYVVAGREALERHNPGGLEVLQRSLQEFQSALLQENHTLKRSLTDPRLFSGIGNAYSDEILHRARLSPVKLSQSLSDGEVETLFEAVRATLTDWIDRLGRQTGDGFPEKVTAFREDMAVHGRYGQPCPVCRTPVQRIVHAENEVNYCPTCQTGGRLLADRSLSRLLKSDWPRTIEEMEERSGRRERGRRLRRQPSFSPQRNGGTEDKTE